MKQNYKNKTKHRSAWFALVLLMLTALPITAQTAGTRFQVDGYYYEVVDATAKTVKVTWANQKATTVDAKDVKLASSTDKLANDNGLKGYNGTPKQEEVDEPIPGKAFNNTSTNTTQTVSVVKIPKKSQL